MRLLPVFVSAALACGCVAATTQTPAPNPAPPPAAPSTQAPNYVCGTCQRDTHEQLQGTLWMQTSAEYRASADATYRWATEVTASRLFRSALGRVGESQKSRAHPGCKIIPGDGSLQRRCRFLS